MQIMKAVWVEAVSALNFVQYNLNVSCLYYHPACCEDVLNV